MSTTLSSSNLKSVKADIPKKGFRTKFWREYRSAACKGSGVGKALDALEALGVPPSGDPRKGDLTRAEEMVPVYLDLSNALTKAKGKCGKLQKQSREFCEGYLEHVRKYITAAEKLAQGEANRILMEEQSNKLAYEKIEKEALAKAKKTKLEHDKLVRQELAKIETTADQIAVKCKGIEALAKKGLDDVANIAKRWKDAHGKQGAPQEAIEQAARKAIESSRPKFKIDAGARALDGQVVGAIETLTKRWKNIKAGEDTRSDHTDAGKSIADARRTHEYAAKALGDYNIAHAQALRELDEVVESRPQSV